MLYEEEQEKIEEIMKLVIPFVCQGREIHYSLRLIKAVIAKINQVKAELIREAVEEHIRHGEIDRLTIKGL
jgi:acid stress-induced BolA-like protein IbaG/YrbA